MRETFQIRSIDFTMYASVLLFISGFVYTKILSVKKYNNVQNSAAVVIYIIAVSAFVLNLINYYQPFTTSREYRLIFSIFFIAVECTAYYLFYRLTQEYNEKIELNIMNKRSEDEKEIMKISEHNIEELKIIRHELKNQYSYMKLLLEKKQYAELNKFFSNMEEENLPSLQFMDCGNNIVNAIINLEKRKAKAEKISLETKLCVIPAKVNIKDSDFTSLLTNLIDNAIEAASKLEDNKNIQIEIKQKDRYMFIQVINPVSSDTKDQVYKNLRTTKKKSNLHGYGTKIINRIVNKYDGSVIYRVKDGYFVADIMLAVNEISEAV